MESNYAILQTAIFDRLQSCSSWNALSQKHAVGVEVLRRAYASWSQALPESQPVTPEDIHVPPRKNGRPTILTAEEEDVIAKSVLYYADNNTPLTRNGIRDLVHGFVSLLPLQVQNNRKLFPNNRPSLNWVKGFLRRNDLKAQHVELMEDKRVKAVTPENLTEHIARVQAAINRYHIKDPELIFNTDQSGSSFDKMKGRSLRKGIGAPGTKLLQKAICTKGNLDLVTVMSIVSASGVAYKPAIVFPGTLAHYRRVRGQIQSLHSVLPPCYLFHRNPPGANSDIVFQWATGFLEETAHLRRNGQRLLLLLDGYGSHVQYRTLKLFADNNVIVIALPAHSSHVTQPLDKTVFTSYKSHLQSELHRAARQKQKLNAFDVGQCISNAYFSSHTAPNIRSGFHKTGIWDMELLTPNIAPLVPYMIGESGERVSRVTVKELLKEFERHQRTLLRDVLVEEEGHIRVNTTAGAHLTSDAVVEALRQRAAARLQKQRDANARVLAMEYREPKADIRRLVELAPARAIKRSRLAQTRKARRELRRSRARCVGLFGL